MKTGLSILPLCVVVTVLAAVPVVTASVPGVARTLVAPCTLGLTYDPACDVDHDGDVDIADIQLTAGHWNQAGAWTSDNNHNHLGQMWSGSDNPLEIVGSFSTAGSAALILSTSAGDGLRINASQDDGVYVASAGARGLLVSSAGLDGVSVTEAGGDGVIVSRAGTVAEPGRLWLSLDDLEGAALPTPVRRILESVRA